MALVDYSDSEASESEQTTPLPARTVPADATTVSQKNSFQKVVNHANPRKVIVNLPGLATSSKEGNNGGDDIEKDRPAKRAKTASAFSGFNSFLPPPKNPNKALQGSSGSTNGSTLSRSRGVGLGHGVSLRTGATPAFSRDAPQDIYLAQEEQEALHADEEEITEVTVQTLPVIKGEIKLVGKPMMFRPLSVARKGPPKKKSRMEGSAVALPTNAKVLEHVPAQQTSAIAKAPTPKIKQSLFSTFNDDDLPIPPLDENSGFDQTTADVMGTESYMHSTADEVNTTAVPSFIPEPAPANSLSSLADNLGLSAAERRQLFGRNGSAGDARVSNFSLAAEYSHNNKLLESEDAAPAHNPVRAIAPGKHSLQQLLNAATNQKEALEESFASGKRNRKDAGSRYGW